MLVLDNDMHVIREIADRVIVINHGQIAEGTFSRICQEPAVLEVWVGETFGMSQRGGSVVSHVRIGRDILSPITPEGSGHVILGLEPLETLRVACKFLKRGGDVILNPKPS